MIEKSPTIIKKEKFYGSYFKIGKLMKSTLQGETANISKILLLTAVIIAFDIATPYLYTQMIQALNNKEDYKIMDGVELSPTFLAVLLVTFLTLEQELPKLRDLSKYPFLANVTENMLKTYLEFVLNISHSHIIKMTPGEHSELLSISYSNASDLWSQLITQILPIIISMSIAITFASIYGSAWVSLGIVFIIGVYMSYVTVTAPKVSKMQASFDEISLKAYNQEFNMKMNHIMINTFDKGHEMEEMGLTLYHLRNKIVENKSLPEIIGIIRSLISGAGLLALLVYIVNRVSSGRLSSANSIMAIYFAMRFIGKLSYVGEALNAVRDDISKLKKLVNFYDTAPQVTDPYPEARPKLLQPGRARIEFRHVTFAYNGNDKEKVLDDVSFTLEPGQTLGVIGESGEGKSTAFGNLLFRFYEPDQGEILIDDQPINKLGLKWLRRLLARAAQNPVIFNTTLRKNIEYGAGGRTVGEAQLREAIKLAELESFVQSHELGLETMMGEGGEFLSGGQKQRIEMARALIKNTPILILDEPTASLDDKTAKSLQNNLETLQGKKTIIIITHRWELLENVDKIIMLKAGKIVWQGNYEQLLKLNLEELNDSHSSDGSYENASASNSEIKIDIPQIQQNLRPKLAYNTTYTERTRLLNGKEKNTNNMQTTDQEKYSFDFN